MTERMNKEPSIDSICKAIKTGPHPPPPPADMFDPTSVMALFLVTSEIHLLFIQKADVEGYPWANQMAFPGGHKDQTDTTTMQTALRELEEEMGIVSKNVEVIGSLGHFQTLNNKDIEAWTGVWNQADTIEFDTSEISRVIKIPLSHLIRIHTENRYHFETPRIMQLIYPFEDVRVWGATAKIIYHMLNLILK